MSDSQALQVEGSQTSGSGTYELSYQGSTQLTNDSSAIFLDEINQFLSRLSTVARKSQAPTYDLSFNTAKIYATGQ